MTITRKMIFNMRRLLQDDQGQSTTEYILILGIVVIIAMKFKEKIVQRILGSTDILGNNIDRILNSSE